MRLRACLPAALAAAVVVAATTPAHASGISVARFGGAHSHATTTNPGALYYNPAGIALGNGTQLMLDVNWAQRNATYRRFVDAIDGEPDASTPEGQAAIDANTGEGRVSNFIYSPMIGVTSDFGTGAPFAVGLAFYAPFGGQSVWDKVEGSDTYPGQVDGPQRWYVTEGTIRTLAFTLGGAYYIEPARLSIGVGANLYLSEIDTARARTASGRDTLAVEGRSYLNAESTDFGLGVGLLAEPLENRLWVGLSYQTAPGFNGQLEMEGTLQNIFPPNYEDPTDIIITNQLPDILRWGVRFRPVNDVELRLFGDYTRWSRLEQQCIMGVDGIDRVNERRAEAGQGSLSPYELCEANSDGSATREGVDGAIVQNLVRRWQDAAGVRFGASYWLNPRIELQADVGYDGNAIPDESLEPALMDFNKMSVGLGGRFQVAHFLHLNLFATNVFYFDRDTTGVDTANRFQPPATQPNSAGKYSQNVFVLNTNLEFGFGGGRRDAWQNRE